MVRKSPAVGGAAHGNLELLIFGLLLSIPIILFGSELVARLLARFPGFLYLGVFVLVHAAVAMILHDPGNLERIAGDGWAPLGFDLMLVQKYVGVLMFCAFLARWGAWLGRPLSFVAEHSFGLFFIHGIVIAVLMRLPERLSPHVGEPIADLAIYSLFVLAVSMAIVVTAKKLTGRYSRYVVGC